MTVEIVTADVLEWARTYTGPKHHALLADPPYELGFMNRAWDKQGVAFDPATWAALAEHLHPGAFIMAFASSRGWHRLACAIEDAGLRIHPSVFLWANGAGFPKATRVKDAPDFDGHRYGGQALKPAVEPIIVAQVPYAGKPRDCIVATGAGSLWVDGGRVPTGGDNGNARENKSAHNAGTPPGWGLGQDTPRPYSNTAGRWPPNFVLQHAPECRCVGERRVRGSHHGANGTWRNGVNGVCYGGHAAQDSDATYADADGLETVAAWDCVPECPVRRLGEQSGELRTHPGVFRTPNERGMFAPAYVGRVVSEGDTGTAARFFPNHDYALDIAERIAAADPVLYAAKASRAERNRGLPDGERSHHPTVKPLALARWLATLLLPPDAYAPRRILCPFAGSGSEAIGAMLAGWEHVTAVERDPEYVAIGEARVKWWAANRDKAPKVRAMERAEPRHPGIGFNPGEPYVSVARTHCHPAPAPMLPGLEAAP